MFRKTRKIIFNHPREYKAVTIVHEGAAATSGLAEGGLIPTLILDLGDRPDVTELIRLHHHYKSGHALFTWGKYGEVGNHVSLYVEFTRPAKVTFVINFTLQKYDVVVEQILNSGGLFIVSGQRGDRMSSAMDNPKLLLDIPDTGFRPYWNKTCNKFLIKKLKKDGLSKKEAIAFIEKRRESIAELTNVKVP